MAIEEQNSDERKQLDAKILAGALIRDCHCSKRNGLDTLCRCGYVPAPPDTPPIQQPDQVILPNDPTEAAVKIATSIPAAGVPSDVKGYRDMRDSYMVNPADEYEEYRQAKQLRIDQQKMMPAPPPPTHPPKRRYQVNMPNAMPPSAPGYGGYYPCYPPPYGPYGQNPGGYYPVNYGFVPPPGQMPQNYPQQIGQGDNAQLNPGSKTNLKNPNVSLNDNKPSPNAYSPVVPAQVPQQVMQPYNQPMMPMGQQMMQNPYMAQQQMPMAQQQMPMAQQQIPVAQQQMPVAQLQMPMAQQQMPMAQQQMPMVQQQTPMIQNNPQIMPSPLQNQKKENLRNEEINSPKRNYADKYKYNNNQEQKENKQENIQQNQPQAIKEKPQQQMMGYNQMPYNYPNNPQVYYNYPQNYNQNYPQNYNQMNPQYMNNQQNQLPQNMYQQNQPPQNMYQQNQPPQNMYQQNQPPQNMYQQNQPPQKMYQQNQQNSNNYNQNNNVQQNDPCDPKQMTPYEANNPQWEHPYYNGYPNQMVQDSEPSYQNKIQEYQNQEPNVMNNNKNQSNNQEKNQPDEYNFYKGDGTLGYPPQVPVSASPYKCSCTKCLMRPGQYSYSNRRQQELNVKPVNEKPAADCQPQETPQIAQQVCAPQVPIYQQNPAQGQWGNQAGPWAEGPDFGNHWAQQNIPYQYMNDQHNYYPQQQYAGYQNPCNNNQHVMILPENNNWQAPSYNREGQWQGMPMLTPGQNGMAGNNQQAGGGGEQQQQKQQQQQQNQNQNAMPKDKEGLEQGQKALADALAIKEKILASAMEIARPAYEAKASPPKQNTGQRYQ